MGPRVRRSVRALAHALVQLLHERTFDQITVQDILDRAGIGRATFYSHYRNKEDVLLSSFEQVMETFMAQLDLPGSPPNRLIPVGEFLTHVGEVEQFLTSLRTSGKLDEIWALTMDAMARVIEERIVPVEGSTPAMPRQLLARMLAASFMEMLRWWREQRVRAAPSVMDATFHSMASTAMGRARYTMRHSVNRLARRT